MATTTEADTRLTALALPGIPESVPAARWHVRDALRSHGLGEFAEDAAAITSELVTNTVQHARDNGDHGDRGNTYRFREPGSGDHHRVGLLPARPHQARHAGGQRAGPGAADRGGAFGSLGLAAARRRESSLRGTGPGGVTGHGRHLGPADAPRHRRRLLTPVRQARPDPPRQDRVRPVPPGRQPARPPTWPASTRCRSGWPATRSRCSRQTGMSAAPGRSAHTASSGRRVRDDRTIPPRR